MKARVNCSEIPENVHCHLIQETKTMDICRNGVPIPFIIQLARRRHPVYMHFSTLEMMRDSMNKAALTFDDSEKIWKKTAIKKLLNSLE